MEWRIPLVDRVYHNNGGVSVANEDTGWIFTKDGSFNFNFDPDAAESVYNNLLSFDIIGWRIELTVGSYIPSGVLRLYWNFAFDDPGLDDTSGSGSYTAYGPEDDSPGSYVDLDALGKHVIEIGSPYFNSYANTPRKVLDRMRNDTTDGYGRVAGDAGFTGAYKHGYGVFEGASTNSSNGVTLSDVAVVFYTGLEVPEMIYPESIEPSSTDEYILRTRNGEAGWYPELPKNQLTTFNFASPLTTWVATHNFNTYAVNVEVFDNSGTAITADVQYVDVNTVQVNFFNPTTGFLRVFT